MEASIPLPTSLKFLKFRKTVSLAALLIVAVGIGSVAATHSGPTEQPTSPSGSVHDLSDTPPTEYEELVILGTNDIHGALTAESRSGPGNIALSAGGAPALSGYVSILRKRYGDRLIWLDGGDQFQGSLESNTEEGQTTLAFLNAAGLDLAAIGNHEFDYGPVGPDYDDDGHLKPDQQGALIELMKNAKFQYIASNVIESSTSRLPPFPHTQEVAVIERRGIKLGIVGLSTTETPTSTRPELVRGLGFQPLAPVVTQRAGTLRVDPDVQAVIAVAHAGLSCKSKPGADPSPPPGAPVQPFTDDRSGNLCEAGGEVTQLIKALPPNTVQAVIAGHTHSLVYHFIDGVPVVQAGSRGKYINLVHLYFNKQTKKIAPERTTIEGPIPVCLETYGSLDCNAQPSTQWDGKPKPAFFYGERVEPDPAVMSVLQPIIDRYAAIKARVVAQVARPIDASAAEENAMGNLVTDAMREAAQADVAITNPFGLRVKRFASGPLNFGTLYACLPFDNRVGKIAISGQELENLIINAESESKGFFSLSGVQVKIDPQSTRSIDRNGDGKIQPEEVIKTWSILLIDSQGKTRPIEPAGTYTVAISDFLLEGGDGMAWSTEPIRNDPDRVAYLKVFQRDATLAKLERDFAQYGPINSQDHPLVDRTAPRIIKAPFKVLRSRSRDHSRVGVGVTTSPRNTDRNAPRRMTRSRR